MPRIRELRLQGAQFAAVARLTLLCPAYRGIQFLLEPGADGPLPIDLEQRTLLGRAQALFRQLRATAQLVKLARKIRPRLRERPVACADLVLLSRDVRLERPTRRLARGLRLLEFLDTYLGGQQRAGALLERRFGPSQIGLQ